jgi:hypothetical protein
MTLVGRTGFEPATPWSQTRYSTGLNYLPFIRRSVTKAEIFCLLISGLARRSHASIYQAFTGEGGEGGIRTLGRDLSPYDGLANR